MRRVLLIEPEEPVRKQILMAFRETGLDAEAVSGPDDARPLLAEGGVDCVVIGGGPAAMLTDVLAWTSGGPQTVDVVVILRATGQQPPEAGAGAGVAAAAAPALDEREAGLAAIRAGASDFVPVAAGLPGLVTAIQKVAARRDARIDAVSARAASEVRRGQSGLDPSDPTRVAPTLVGRSPRMVALLAAIGKLAPVRANVLVGGESGTGKELVARALHEQSPWRAGPFVPVNCGAIPAGLIEAELFGHVRGAFTDAVRDRRGLFEAAHGGTLFLDEIADLPLALQPKLLRAIQEGEIHRVGDVGDIRVEVRVVAATARDLAAEVAAGRFREDLFYRLSALSIELPALRFRREDIPALAEHFLVRARARLGIDVTGISGEAMRVLLAHPWPGNVRELENTMERAVVMCASGIVDVASLPERLTESRATSSNDTRAGAHHRPGGAPDPDHDVRDRDPVSRQHPGGDDDLSIKRSTRASEESLIRQALRRTRGNRTHAARLLEISQRTLLYKIKAYGIGSEATDET